MTTEVDPNGDSGWNAEPEFATITRWLVREGDWLKRHQEFVEILVNNIIIPFPSAIQGRVRKLLYREGDVFPSAAKIIDIDEEATPPAG